MQQVIVNLALFGLMFYFCQLNWNLVRTNLMLHKELYINCFVITLRMHKPQKCDNSDVTSTYVAHTFVLQIGCVTNHLLRSEMEHLNWQIRGPFEL